MSGKGPPILVAALAAAAFLAGCAAPTPYQPRDRGFGYHDYEMEPGVWFVSFAGNERTTKGEVERHWHRRAAEICGGTDRYEILLLESGGTTTFVPDRLVIVPETLPRVQGKIRCRPAD